MEKTGIRVLSLFDGMSCGRQALERVGVLVGEYYASEIDRYAIEVTMANFGDTRQLGSVTGVDGRGLGRVDLLIGGSPCQSFSFAGKRKGMATKSEEEILSLERYLELKGEGYEFEGQSYLFWEYMRVLGELRELNPGVKFLLENVMMGDKWQRVLSRAIGINPIEINSALVSAQNRRRLYWTNIGVEEDGLFGDLVCKIQPPKDRGILLRDVLEGEVDEKYYLSEKAIKFVLDKTKLEKKYTQNGSLSDKSLPHLAKNQTNWCGDFIVHNMMPRSGDPSKGGTGHLSRNDGKTYCLDTGNTNAVEIVAMRGRGEKGDIEQKLESNGTDKSNSLTTVQKDNLVFNYRQDAPNDINGKKDCLRANAGGVLRGVGIIEGSRIRRLTPLECMRLQTVADDYKMPVSDTQKYKMLGNGWTVDVVAHIFSHLPKEWFR